MTISGQSYTHIDLEDAIRLTDFYKQHPKFQNTDVESIYEGLRSRNEKIFIKCCDITTVGLDAIVCSTQTDLCLPSYGLCTKVWSSGGPVLKQTCRVRKKLKAGTSFITNGYNLPAKYVFFTAGPAPDAPYNYEERLDILRNNYISSLDLLKTREDVRTVAFPCLGTGGGGLDMTDANRVAATAIREWLDIEVNRASVDVILLCMFSQDQWNDYLPELLKAFPYSLDLQGNNLEDLHDVSRKYLELPPCSVSTNNLCYKYEPAAMKTVRKHFHRMIDRCMQTLNYAVTLKRRFRNCGIFMPKRKCDHQVIVLHSEEIHMIEVQVTRFNDHIETIRADICKDLHNCITEYFETNLANITTFQYYLRCHQSFWGQDSGLWEYGETAALSEGRQTCDKHELTKDYHQILCKDMLQYWNISFLNVISPHPLPPAGHRDPVEHSFSSLRSGVSSSNNESVKRPVTLTIHRSIEENDTASPCSSTSESSVADSFLFTPDSYTRLKTHVPSPTEHSQSVHSPTEHRQSSQSMHSLSEHTESSHSVRSQGKGRRKKAKLGDRLGRNEKESVHEKIVGCLVVEDSGNETQSQFSSQVSIGSQDIRNNTLCRNLTNKDLMKLAKHMGSYQKRIGLCLELTETDIQNAIGRAERDTELQGFYIIKKWMSINDDKGTKADVSSLLKVYHECDIDIYQIRQELGIV